MDDNERGSSVAASVLLSFSSPNPQLLSTNPKRLSVLELTARMSVTKCCEKIDKKLEGNTSK